MTFSMHREGYSVITDYTRRFFVFLIFHVLVAIIWFATSMVAYASTTL
jgi:hypothetical protein